MINIQDIINKSPVENFRKAYFEVTEMSISFADDEHKQYNTFYAGSRCEFCRIMNSSHEGLECCVNSSREAGKNAARTGKALIYTCHCGLKEVVVPIIINGKHIGSVFSGQVITEKPTGESYNEISDHLMKLGLSTKEVLLAYEKIPVVPTWKLDLVSNMLKIIVDYIIQTEINQQLKETINRERDKLREIVPYIKSQFVSCVITNNTDKLSEIKDKLKYLGIKRIPNIVLYIKINEMAHKDNENKLCEKPLIVDLIYLELSNMKDILVQSISDDNIALFVYIKEDTSGNIQRDTVQKIAEKLRKMIREKTIFTSIIGISRCSTNSAGLGRAYREAFNACTFGSIMEDDQIVHIDDIQTEGSRGSYVYYDADKLRQNIVLANTSELVSMYYHVFYQFLSNDKIDLDKVKIYTIEFINEVINYAIQMGLDESYTTKKITYFQQLIGICEIQEIYNWGKNIITEIVGDAVKGRANKNKEIIETIKRYIEENYSQELNLEDIASVVYLSPSYFGWLFKKETGETYVEYLTKIRVEKAIYLMRSTNESIFTISAMVGYKDPNYFSQVFKKVEGMRPSNYRKMIKGS